jgi:hypothetical protein
MKIKPNRGEAKRRAGLEPKRNLTDWQTWVRGYNKKKEEGNLERTATKGEPGARDWRRKHPGALVVDSNMGWVAI